MILTPVTTSRINMAVRLLLAASRSDAELLTDENWQQALGRLLLMKGIDQSDINIPTAPAFHENKS